MDEGKPTKPKWWNRTGRQASADTDGDFELQRPAGPGADGDFELQRPREPVATATASGPQGPDATHAEGDVAPQQPAQPPTDDQAPPETAPVTPTAPAPAPATPTAPVPAPASPTAPAPAPASPTAPVPAPVADAASATAAAPTPPVELRKPLHDPDPYSTPPYGEPGPWAPAPPVQHPAATPAHGTVTPTPHGTVTPTAPGTVTPTPHGAPPPPDPGTQSTPASPLSPDVVHQGSSGLAPAPSADTVLPGPGGAAAAASPPVADPWRNYDPWAQPPTPAPLQHIGGPVRRGRRGLVLGALVLALVAGGVGGAIGAYLERNGGVGAVELPQAGKEPAGRAPDSVAGIAARALPSVVTLHVTGSEESGTGTGFVLDDLGHILTNNHVVEPAKSGGRITVTFNSGDTAKATVVGRDSGYDLAVVKVSGVRGLRPMPLGNSDNVQVGDPVVAIGAPFDLAGTVTSGIISAKERPITAGGDSADGTDVSYVDALQTDAPINPGNSGGPLLDSQARVIGINSAIRSADDGSESGSGQAGSIGLGFAIPVNQAKRVAEELINSGHATHPVIGVTLDMSYTGDGARVGTKASGGGPAVTKGGPGDKAGIEPGDVITAVDGQRVHSGEELIVKTRAHRPGDRLELTLRRDGKEKRISLVLGSSDSG
ncbi:trypsin-like peptidase domain-containing protein [Streptomyces sp. NPDC002764]|uniref:trypsin-like peptidase domain-containing protein n=1 Tax=Streptomyces sp. NPDC002764 TaxID=3154428 RepID=UPI00332FDE68